ncbi:MAG: hypothetical protein M1819_001907 [Sarea resinae]|nr:MAG: hypothetical protein M1819_001907 [Sarea resinae]
MSTHTVYLVTCRNDAKQRAHFSIFIPQEADPERGSLIEVIGAPMVGYRLEFRRAYRLADTPQRYTLVPLGLVQAQHMQYPPALEEGSDETVPKNDMERAASAVPPPRISQNFMAPVNDTTNQRCQEWTMAYVRRLVSLHYLEPEALQIVQSHRDPPSHGIGLQPVGVGLGRA